MSSIPTLTLIDQAREGHRLPFSSDPNAEYLEKVAFAHIQDRCSEFIWLTGFISPESLHTLCQRLERLRGTTPVAE